MSTAAHPVRHDKILKINGKKEIISKIAALADDVGKGEAKSP
jgi:hypothetical protein